LSRVQKIVGASVTSAGLRLIACLNPLRLLLQLPTTFQDLVLAIVIALKRIWGYHLNLFGDKLFYHVRGVLERTRGDLTLTMCLQQLETALKNQA
jgi:hypothetical protein